MKRLCLLDVLDTALPLALGLAILSPTSTSAQSPDSPSGVRRWLEQDYMLGTWGGLRTNLSQRGVDFEFFYAGSVPNNLDGGLQSGGVYEGALMMILELDSKKLAGYEGGTFHASSLWLHGEKPFSASYIGDLNKVNLLDFNNSARLWELWYQQKFFDGKLAVKVGELSIDRDFIVPEYYNSLSSLTLINQTFFFPTLCFDVYDIPGFPIMNHGLAATPNAAPGVLVRWNPSPDFYAQAAVYGGNPDQTYSGTQFTLSQEEGALAYFEFGYRLNQGTNNPGLEGSYKLGGFYHTSDFVDMSDSVTSSFLSAAGFGASPIRQHTGNYGGYLQAEQQLFLEQDKSDPARQGLVGFFRLAAAPADRNLAEFGADGGLMYRGLVPGRNWDTLAAAVSYLQISDDISKAQEQANLLAPGSFVVYDYETVIEVSYKAQMTPWWTLQPSLQYVFHPGGSAATPDATVFILQTTFRF